MSQLHSIPIQHLLNTSKNVIYMVMVQTISCCCCVCEHAVHLAMCIPNRALVLFAEWPFLCESWHWTALEDNE